MQSSRSKHRTRLTGMRPGRARRARPAVRELGCASREASPTRVTAQIDRPDQRYGSQPAPSRRLTPGMPRRDHARMTLHPTTWWQHGVVYQIYPRSFRDTNGDGVGDLAGVLSKIKYLSETLGIDAIWLSPFYPSPMADFGYDVSDYVDVDPLFGDLAAFDALVAAAHARGISVIVDYVPGHTSNQHAWFKASRSSRDNPYHDWYVWRDPKPDGSLPNNWLATFGGPSWEWDSQRGQYYLHSYLPEQADLNWRNPAVHAAMLDVLRFWLDRGVDGFRMDAL